MKVKGNTPVIERLNAVIEMINDFKNEIGSSNFTIKTFMEVTKSDLATANFYIKKSINEGIINVISPGHRGRGGAGVYQFNN